mmetsp:Transcript_21680/g.60162  ORF Transcript_21680/g.60162 Transcript_21680/m.60162 type:complete len:104 (+) Transcript_21680:674-985(+)|eukprot:1157563-Pelagomonas_calceolata.AAC.14
MLCNSRVRHMALLQKHSAAAWRTGGENKKKVATDTRQSLIATTCTGAFQACSKKRLTVLTQRPRPRPTHKQPGGGLANISSYSEGPLMVQTIMCFDDMSAHAG